MVTKSNKLLPLMGEMSDGFAGDVSLASLASRCGLSESYFQRRFTGFAGESPKKYTLRVRLARAAAELLATDSSILDIALSAGFSSHEVFTRAFSRQFGRSPKEFRAGIHMSPAKTQTNREVIQSVSPCIRLYRISLSDFQEQQAMPTSAIERREIQNAQPVLFIQRRIPVNQLQQTMGECFGALYGHGQQAGLPIAGQPISRYVSTGAGLWTVDFVMPLIEPADGVGDMRSGTLQAGPVAFAMHEGPYDQLSESYAAIEKWIEDMNYETGGPPWESYVTDPAETPDPADWRTEIFWPLKG